VAMAWYAAEESDDALGTDVMCDEVELRTDM
jgi:hypothetical protein